MDSFCPWLQPMVSRVLEYPDFGSKMATITEIKSSAPRWSIERKTLGDSFLLIVPYAEEFIKFHILLDYSRPYAAPDFVFGDDFAPGSAIDESLLAWDSTVDTSLLEIITAILADFKDQQIIIFNDDLSMREQLLTIPDESKVSYDYYFISNSSDKLYNCFIFAFEATIASLAEAPPALFEPKYQNDDQVVLKVICPDRGTSKYVFEIMTSSAFKSAYGSIDFEPPDTDCIHEFISHLVTWLEELVQLRNERFKKNKRFVEILDDDFFTDNVACNNDEMFTSVTIVFPDVQVKIFLPDNYSKPVVGVELMSVSLENANKRPIVKKERINGLSPGSSVRTHVKYVSERVVDMVNKFKPR